MTSVERTKYRFGNPSVPNWQPPKRRPTEVTMCDHLATPSFEELKLKHFVASDVMKMAGMGDKEERTLACFWMPTRTSINRIAAVAEKAHNGDGLPLVLDIGTGNGFLPFLLASTGRVRVAGIDPNPVLLTGSRFSQPNLELACADAAWAVKKYQGYASLVIQSWPPLGIDLFRFARDVAAGAIMTIFDPNCYGSRANKYHSLKGYNQRAFWEGPSSGNLNLAILRRGFSFDGNRFTVFLKNGEGPIGLNNDNAGEEKEYPWIVEAREQFGAGFTKNIGNAEKVRQP